MTITLHGSDRYEDIMDNFFAALSEAAESTKVYNQAGKEKVYEINITDLRALHYRLSRLIEDFDK